MPTDTNADFRDVHSRPARPLRSQSSWRWAYFPEERMGRRVRPLTPNAFVLARMGPGAFHLANL